MHSKLRKIHNQIDNKLNDISETIIDAISPFKFPRNIFKILVIKRGRASSLWHEREDATTTLVRDEIFKIDPNSRFRFTLHFIQ